MTLHSLAGRLLGIAALALPGILMAAQPDPLDANAAVPAQDYRSPLKDYRAQADEPLQDWRAANDLVGRIGGWRTYTRLVLPGASPQIAAGLRASLTVAIVLMVVSEMVAANSGIGFFILQAQAEFAIKKMWTGILVLAVIGTVLNYLFVFIERRVLRWYYRSRALAAS